MTFLLLKKLVVTVVDGDRFTLEKVFAKKFAVFFMKLYVGIAMHIIVYKDG